MFQALSKRTLQAETPGAPCGGIVHSVRTYIPQNCANKLCAAGTHMRSHMTREQRQFSYTLRQCPSRYLQTAGYNRRETWYDTSLTSAAPHFSQRAAALMYIRRRAIRTPAVPGGAVIAHRQSAPLFAAACGCACPWAACACLALVLCAACMAQLSAPRAGLLPGSFPPAARQLRRPSYLCDALGRARLLQRHQAPELVAHAHRLLQ